MRWLDVNEEMNNVAPTDVSGHGYYMRTHDGNHDWPHKIRAILDLFVRCRSRIDDMAVVILEAADVPGIRSVP
jgi:hypothetical protein